LVFAPFEGASSYHSLSAGGTLILGVWKVVEKRSNDLKAEVNFLDISLLKFTVRSINSINERGIL
jgi:hypothetical protein